MPGAHDSLVVAGGSYAGLFLILLWQALRGQALVSPDAVTLRRARRLGRRDRGRGVALSHAAGIDDASAELDQSMTADQTFDVLNLVAMGAWVLLALSPWLPRVTTTVTGKVVPALLAAVYVVLVAGNIGGSEGGFSSLAGVASLFSEPWILLAGWTHYLAFDLLVGNWEMRDATTRGLPYCAGPAVPRADVSLRSRRLAALRHRPVVAARRSSVVGGS